MKKEKNLTITLMAVQNIKSKPFRAGLMIFFVLLMSATFFFSTILMDNLKLGIQNTTARMGADIILAPKDATEGIRQSLFAGKPCSVFMDKEWENTTASIDGVLQVSPQLYLATLSASCCDAAVQLIAFVPETDFVVTPWLESKNNKPLLLQQGEIIVGAGVTFQVGDTATFYQTDFKVAGKLDKTGMGYDNSVFMTFETAYLLKDSAAAKVSMDTENLDRHISMLIVDIADGIDGMDKIALQRRIEKARPDAEKVYAYTADELVSGIAQQVKKLSGYGTLLMSMMVISTALALICIFILTMNERKFEFGILYALGAKKSQMTLLILVEALLISGIGGITGALLSGYLIILFKDLICIKLEIPYLNLDMQQVLPIVGKCLGISLTTGIIAAGCSAYRIGKGEAYRLIRENEG